MSFEEQSEINKEYEKYCDACNEELNAMMILVDCGVPFNEYGEPLGIGWD